MKSEVKVKDVQVKKNILDEEQRNFNKVFFLIFKNIYIYLFLATWGLCCCAWAFSSCGERGLLFVAVRGLLIVMASLVAEHGL